MELRAEIDVLTLIPRGIIADGRVEMAAAVLWLELVEAHGIEGVVAHSVHEELDEPYFILVAAESTNTLQCMFNILNDDKILLADFASCTRPTIQIALSGYLGLGRELGQAT